MVRWHSKFFRHRFSPFEVSNTACFASCNVLHRPSRQKTAGHPVGNGSICRCRLLRRSASSTHCADDFVQGTCQYCGACRAHLACAYEGILCAAIFWTCRGYVGMLQSKWPQSILRQDRKIICLGVVESGLTRSRVSEHM